MKTIKTAAGIRRIEDSGDPVSLFKLREVLYEHRKTLIGRIVSDVNAYVDYRFHKKLTGKSLDGLRTKLQDLAHSPLDLERYDPIVQDFQHQQHIALANALFYQEIDLHIHDELNASQLKLVD